jgi:hypothetical protein
MWGSGGHGGSGDVVPNVEGLGASRSMITGSQAMTVQLKMVLDPAVDGEEMLGPAS